jgi:hypothetical protein
MRWSRVLVTGWSSAPLGRRAGKGRLAKADLGARSRSVAAVSQNDHFSGRTVLLHAAVRCASAISSSRKVRTIGIEATVTAIRARSELKQLSPQSVSAPQSAGIEGTVTVIPL